ncbi:MAG: type 4a pilus biogenesis protein PilO [Armatimonadetes bacterium]|nr:type 4a pilus biogenesis protein PilO [Armatimonadota bacterium]
MNNLKPSRRTNLILIVISVVMLVACGVSYFFLSRQVGEIQAQVDMQEKKLGEGQKLASRLASIEQAYQTARQEISFLESALPTREFTPTLLQQIEKLAKGEKLRVMGVRPQISAAPQGPSRTNPDASEEKNSKNAGGKKQEKKKEVQPPYDKLQIELALNGNYFDVMNFVRKLTRFPKILSVSSLAIRSNNKDKLKGSQLDIKLNLEAYVLKEKPVVSRDEAGKGNSNEV